MHCFSMVKFWNFQVPDLVITNGIIKMWLIFNLFFSLMQIV